MFEVYDIEAARRLAVLALVLATAIISTHWSMWIKDKDQASISDMATALYNHLGDTRLSLLLYEVLLHSKLVIYGITIKAYGWFIHQLFWYANWVLTSNGLVDLQSSQLSWLRHYIVFGAEFIVFVGTLLMLSPYLHMYFGKRWALAGTILAGAIFLLGLIIGHPDVKS